MSIYRNAIYTDDNIASSEPFAINNVGYTMIDTYKTVTSRPKGRNDYQLIYIKQGIGYFELGGRIVPVDHNNIVLFKPGQPQIYTYYPQDCTETFWIHFSGTQVEQTLLKIGFDSVEILPFSSGNIFINTANQIFDEMRRQPEYWHINCVSALISLLIAIRRDNGKPERINNLDAINHIRLSIENNYYLDISNREYAKSCDMCISNFLRLFKEVTGTTPQHYKTIQRIKMAENLLRTSSYSISQIAKIVGFSDSLYFSRMFHKFNNLSPTEYRNQYSVSEEKHSN